MVRALDLQPLEMSGLNHGRFLPGYDSGQVIHPRMFPSRRSIICYWYKDWAGNGKLWKRCVPSSIKQGASSLPAEKLEMKMSAAAVSRRAVRWQCWL